jgi:hypothetical protein
LTVEVEGGVGRAIDPVGHGGSLVRSSHAVQLELV